MKALIHKDLTYEVLCMPEFERLRVWLFCHLGGEHAIKEWADMPDNNKHYSKIPGEHSFKIDENGIVHDSILGTNLVTNIQRDTKDFKDWLVETEFDSSLARVAAIEVAKVFHWIVDMSTPPHVCFGWSSKQHSRFETKISRYYKKHKDVIIQVHSNASTPIRGHIDSWAVKFIKSRYDNNIIYYNMTKDGSIGDDQFDVVIDDVIENLKSYFDYIQRYLDKKKIMGW